MLWVLLRMVILHWIWGSSQNDLFLDDKHRWFPYERWWFPRRPWSQQPPDMAPSASCPAIEPPKALGDLGTEFCCGLGIPWADGNFSLMAGQVFGIFACIWCSWMGRTWSYNALTFAIFKNDWPGTSGQTWAFKRENQRVPKGGYLLMSNHPKIMHDTQWDIMGGRGYTVVI